MTTQDFVHVTPCLPCWEIHMWVLEWDGSQVTSSFSSFVSSFVPWQLWRRGPSSTLISKVFLVNGLSVWSPWAFSVVWRGGLFPRGVKTGSVHLWIRAGLGPHSCNELEWALSQVVLEVKNPPAKAGDGRDTGSIPVLGRSPGQGHGNPLQYSCLENLMDRAAWWATVHRATKSRTRLKQLSTLFVVLS